MERKGLSRGVAKQETLSFDLAESDNVALVGYLSRIRKLLAHQATNSDKDLQATLDLFLGAVYAMISAKTKKFTDRPDGTSIDLLTIIKRAQEPQSGELRLDGPWIAGFHFNGALLRLAGVYHRPLKIVKITAPRDKYVGALLQSG